MLKEEFCTRHKRNTGSFQIKTEVGISQSEFKCGMFPQLGFPWFVGAALSS